MKPLCSYTLTILVCGLLGLWIGWGTRPKAPATRALELESAGVAPKPLRIPSEREVLELQALGAQVQQALATAEYYRRVAAGDSGP